jgi:hypothetical protein
LLFLFRIFLNLILHHNYWLSFSMIKLILWLFFKVCHLFKKIKFFSYLVMLLLNIIIRRLRLILVLLSIIRLLPILLWWHIIMLLCSTINTNISLNLLIIISISIDINKRYENTFLQMEEEVLMYKECLDESIIITSWISQVLNYNVITILVRIRSL